MKRQVFFLDQGETMGGAERFLLDFFRDLNGSEIRQLNPILLGAKHPKYRELLPEGISAEDFFYPSVRGGIFKKVIICIRLFFAAHRLVRRVMESEAEEIIIFSNTARTHFVMLLAKHIFRIPGKWVVMMHDFTVPGFLLRRIARSAHIVAVNALVTREDTRKKIHPRDYKKIQIIENGIDFSAIPTPRSPKRIQKIISIGRIDPRKGQRYAVEVAAILQKKRPELEFSVVGTSFPEDPRTVVYEEEIHALAQQKRLKNLTFVGEVNDPFTEILKADLLIFLPTVPEPFGRVAVEGLALGKLVLAFNEIGPRETLSAFQKYIKQENKLLVEARNAEVLAERILYFVDHPTEIPTYTEKAREFVEKHYAQHEITKRILLAIFG